MIGSLRGSVLERLDDGRVLVEVGGVGYLVTVTPRTLAELEPTSPVFLYVHHHIREDAQTLFGFLRRDERAAFDVLIATHGIGPALAVAILGTHSPSALVDIVAGNDLGALTLVPGVGKKTAERLLVELRNRLNLPMLDPMSTVSRQHHRRQCPRGAVRSRLCIRGDPRGDARSSGVGICRRAVARCSPIVGSATCVRSSSILRPPTKSKRSTRSACGPGGSASSSARGS